jgi:hypothetical protein
MRHPHKHVKYEIRETILAKDIGTIVHVFFYFFIFITRLEFVFIQKGCSQSIQLIT